MKKILLSAATTVAMLGSAPVALAGHTVFKTESKVKYHTEDVNYKANCKYKLIENKDGTFTEKSQSNVKFHTDDVNYKSNVKTKVTF